MRWHNSNTSLPKYSLPDDLYDIYSVRSSMEAVKVGRKRRSSDSSEAHAEAPKPKKKKKAIKPELSPPLESVTAPDLLPLDGANGSAADKNTDGGKVNSSLSSSQTDATLGKTTKKAARVKPRNYFKPHNGSWMTHMASVVVHRCVSQALAQSIDPRPHLNEINWGLMSESLLRPEDVKMLWYYIRKEYPEGTPLTEVAATLAPYSKLSVDQFVREDIKLKYKDQVPKQPLSAYMLFSKSKGPKLKAKHPELSQTEMAVKLGKKWKSMGPERQEKYKQQYSALRMSYKTQLEQFYSDHPDAKPPRVSATTSKQQKKKLATFGKPELTPEEKRLQELKQLMPKAPTTTYFLFCKAKRGKLQKKHPELSPVEVTAKLGRKWKSMGEEGKAKYKRVYEESVSVYHQQMEEFYKQHPDAKELLAKKKKKASSVPLKNVTSTSTQTANQAENEEAEGPEEPMASEPMASEPMASTSEHENEGEEEEEESEGELEVDLEKGHNGAVSPGTMDSSEDSNSEEN